MRTRVKICGITSVEDAQAAAAAGADALGLVFFAASKRCVSISQAVDIRKKLPAFVTLVGLFVDEIASEVKKVQASVGLDLIQYHGGESTDYCDQIELPYIKAVKAKNENSVLDCVRQYPNATAILVDSYVKGQAGGTGESFNWNLVPQSVAGQIILAGGLDSDNVGPAITKLKPYAVDVSSGVEQSPGIKSGKMLVNFIESVRQVDRYN